MTNLDVAFNYLLQDEGRKYVNDPDDSGGPTKFGITKKTYQDFFGHVALDSEIERMSAAVAKQIYAALYWAPLHCGEIRPLAFSIAFFDSAVLYGVGTTALIVQHALSIKGATIKLDGILGDKSLELINTIGGGRELSRVSLMHTFHGLLLEHIDAIIAAHPKDEKYRRGWVLRADRLLQLLNDEYLNKFKTTEVL